MKINQHVLNMKKDSYVKEEPDYDINDPNIVDCSYGINPFGYSEIIDKSVELKYFINNYPNYPYVKLKTAIKDYYRDLIELNINNIRAGSGSMIISELICKVLVEKGIKILGISPQFTDFIGTVKSFGGDYDYLLLEEKDDFEIDVNKLLQKFDKGEYRLIYIDNPNNPTGQIISLDDIEKVIQIALKKETYVIIDEAYGDFMSLGNSAVNLINKYENLIVMKSFSKGFGLAGVRCGYVIANEFFIEQFIKMEPAFLLSSIAEHIAITALSDKKFIDNSISMVKKVKEKTTKIIKSIDNLDIVKTSDTTPILTVKHRDKNINLYDLLLDCKIVTESGKDFNGLGINYVRLRIPTDIEKFEQNILKLKQY